MQSVFVFSQICLFSQIYVFSHTLKFSHRSGLFLVYMASRRCRITQPQGKRLSPCLFMAWHSFVYSLCQLFTTCCPTLALKGKKYSSSVYSNYCKTVYLAVIFNLALFAI